LSTSREHVIALEPRGKGLLGITLRYPYEVRKEDEYFEEIPDEKIPKDMLELASYIVETNGHFNPEEFEDHYEDALKELLKKKQAGEKIEAPKERAPAKVINLMDALRRSVGQFPAMEITDEDVDRIEVVGDLIHHIKRAWAVGDDGAPIIETPLQ
jgi:Ku protein